MKQAERTAPESRIREIRSYGLNEGRRELIIGFVHQINYSSSTLRAPTEAQATWVKVPSVELDDSQPKTVSGKRLRSQTTSGIQIESAGHNEPEHQQ